MIGFVELNVKNTEALEAFLKSGLVCDVWFEDWMEITRGAYELLEDMEFLKWGSEEFSLVVYAEGMDAMDSMDGGAGNYYQRAKVTVQEGRLFLTHIDTSVRKRGNHVLMDHRVLKDILLEEFTSKYISLGNSVDGVLRIFRKDAY